LLASESSLASKWEKRNGVGAPQFFSAERFNEGKTALCGMQTRTSGTVRVEEEGRKMREGSA